LHRLISASLVSNPEDRASASDLLQVPQVQSVKDGTGHSVLLSVPMRSTLSDLSRSRSTNSNLSSKTPLSINSSLPLSGDIFEFAENLRTPTGAEQSLLNTPFGFLSSQSAPRR
jgi:hypothetical protein